MHYFRIRELMAKHEAEHGERLFLKDVAERSGVSAAVITRMASPDGYVTNTRHVEALCRFFGVGPTELFLFRPPINPEGEPVSDLMGLDDLGRPT